MVLWAVLSEKEDVELFMNAIDEESRKKVVDNVWLVYYDPPKNTPNPCEHFRDKHQALMAGLKGQIVIGYVQAIAGFGDEEFAARISKWAARTEEDGEAAAEKNSEQDRS